MRLQVTERIVLIYSNVSVVRVGKYRYRIRGENVTAKHCRECDTGEKGGRGEVGLGMVISEVVKRGWRRQHRRSHV